MKITKEIISEITAGYNCDLCGKNVNDNHDELYSREPGILRYENHTTCTQYRCELCQDCFFKVVDFIHLIGGKVTKECWNTERSEDED